MRRGSPYGFSILAPTLCVLLVAGCGQQEGKDEAPPGAQPAAGHQANDKPANRPKEPSSPPPSIHHILLEVDELDRSIAFYRDQMGLSVVSRSGDFATLESGNVGVYLWSKRWDWELPRQKGERNGLGMYPHFAVDDVMATIKRLKSAGFSIVQEPREYKTFSEAFVADPDGYIWALIKTK